MAMFLQVVTPCGHFFCTDCITQWLRMHGSGRKCPVCREDLSALARKLSTALRRPEDKAREAEEADGDSDSDDSEEESDCTVQPQRCTRSCNRGTSGK